VFPDVLADRIRSVLVAAGVTSPDDEAVRVARPLRSEHGDYSTPVALRLARTTGRDPAELAELVAAGLRADDGIEEATVAAGGHVNIRFTPADLAETARELSRRPPAAGPPSDETPETPETSETRAELARLLRGADALGVPEEPVDADDLSAPTQRQLICVLAETAGLAKRKPEKLPSHLAEIVLLWQHVEMVQPILPVGDEIPTIRHSSGRLLVAATRATLSGVEPLP
jgi:hypothetical protein